MCGCAGRPHPGPAGAPGNPGSQSRSQRRSLCQGRSPQPPIPLSGTAASRKSSFTLRQVRWPLPRAPTHDHFATLSLVAGPGRGPGHTRRTVCVLNGRASERPRSPRSDAAAQVHVRLLRQPGGSEDPIRPHYSVSRLTGAPRALRIINVQPRQWGCPAPPSRPSPHCSQCPGTPSVPPRS